MASPRVRGNEAHVSHWLVHFRLPMPIFPSAPRSAITGDGSLRRNRTGSFFLSLLRKDLSRKRVDSTAKQLGILAISASRRRCTCGTGTSRYWGGHTTRLKYKWMFWAGSTHDQRLVNGS